MTNIRIEMNFYQIVKEYVVMVLFDNAEGESSSICYYPKNKREAVKTLTSLESQYNIKGIVNV